MPVVVVNSSNSRYARRKRSVKICAGESPCISRSFVHTNVVPQMAMVRKATRCATTLFEPFDILAHIFAYFREILLHPLGILAVDDVEQVFQLLAYLFHLTAGVGVEQNLL